jgi:flavin-dependent dehydrogenase
MTATGLDGLDAGYDVIVVGARAAGAATAMLLARRGLRVLAVDRGAYGADTLSTHALMRAGVLQLAHFGLLDRIEAAGTPPVRRTVFHYEDAVVDIPIKPKAGVPALFAPRRTLLDRVLVDAAAEAGACVRHRVRLTGLRRGALGRVEGATLADERGNERSVRASIVVGADGLRSTVAGLVAAPLTHTARHAAASVYAYWSGLEADGYQWYWRAGSAGSAAGAIPTNDGALLVFVGTTPERFAAEFRRDVARGYRALLREAAPDLARRLEGAERGRFHGFAGHPGYLRRPWGPGWALVGDAAYFKDPITAHGLSDALRDAELLAAAIACGNDGALADYETQRDLMSRELLETTDAIASLRWDNARLKELHERLSEAMKHEVAELVRLHQQPLAALRRTA